MKPKISVSILSADFANLQRDVDKVKNADYLHIDVMDGHFVPPLTIGPVVIKDLKTNLLKDVHLMVTDPEKHIASFREAGADIITFHAEAVKDPLEIIMRIKKLGAKAGVSLNPDTPLDPIKPYLSKIDHILVMSVFPGYAGQKFIPDVIPKIRALRAIFTGDIAVDGGINADTGREVVAAGANILVAASYVYKSDNPSRQVEALKNCG